MSRPLHADTSTALAKPIIPLAAIVYLDIENDPLYVWTGLGDLVFTPAQTGDTGLDGFTFKGGGSILELSGVSEGAGGSDSLEIAFPGVDPTQPLWKQLMVDKRRWQFRRALVWLMLLDKDTGAIAGKPFRIKTGRMDEFPYEENQGKGFYKCVIEGQQAYANDALHSRYSEQIDIDPNDTSQRWVHNLANMSAQIGKHTAPELNKAIAGTRQWFATAIMRRFFGR
jgi:hypothetical protein